LDHVARLWSKHFIPKRVKAKPYKLIIYGPGDHFSWHKDTPEEKLCGTFLVSLFEDCEPRGAFEIIKDGEGSETWSSRSYNGWCAFYPDTPHRVNELKSGFRAILSFKIFVEEPNEGPWGDKIQSKLVDRITDDLQKVQSPVGILLKHHYGYDSDTIYGCDKLLLKIIEVKGLNVEIMPVLVRFNSEHWISDEWGSCEKPSVSSSVYAITDDALELVRNRMNQSNETSPAKKKQKTAQIAFLDGDKGNNSGLWERNVQEAAEHTGNESLPGTEHSVYARYAAVIKHSAK
jgi:hypothetical protein